jgi:hypothetical protein
MTETARGPCLRERVQTSPDMAAWTTRADLCMEQYVEGQGEIAGSADFRLDWGEIDDNGADIATVTDLADPGGLYCRILKENAAGTGAITIDAVTYDPVWWGKMLSPDAATTAASGTTMYQAVGIAGVLHERVCWLGRCLVKTSPATYSIAFNLAPFNHWPSGDRSTATASVDGVSVYVHDATATATGNAWTARQILDNLFACNFKYEHPPTPDGSGQLGLGWAISDPQSCLAYDTERLDFRGKTLAQVLNNLAGKGRGLTWWVTVSSTTLTINVASGLVTALTVGTHTIPANPAVWDQLDDTDPFLHPVTIQTVTDEVADEIVERASPRKIGITLAIYGTGTPWTSDSASQLVKGWADAAETACDTYLDTGGNARGRRLASYEHAWCRFELRREGWNGAQYGSSGMPDALTTATSASYGTVGYTGEATRVGLSTLAGLWYTADGDLPCAPGFTALNVGPRQKLVIVAEDYAAGTWFDHSRDWTVHIESNPPAVIIDDGADGAIVRAILRDGRKILVSLTLIDFMPLQVMWRRNPADWIAVPPRTRVTERPELGMEYLLAGMVTGVSSESGGTLTTTASVVTTRDDLPRLRTLLAQARAWFEEPYRIGRFTDRGVWDSDATYRPGTILGNLTDGLDPRVVEATVSRRIVRKERAKSDNGSEVCYWSTTWETDIVYPDADAHL